MSVDHERLRKRAATLAAAAAALKQRHEALGGMATPFSLAFLTNRRRIADPAPIILALPAGAAVIYRDYDDPRRAETAHRYASVCRERGVLFIVGEDGALARAVRADGLHLPARLLSSFSPRRGEKVAEGRMRGASPRGPSSLHGPLHPDPLPPKTGGEGERKFLLTAACHDAKELLLAGEIGADLAFLAPAFPTKSHPNTEHLGPERFKSLAAGSKIPVLALGGIDETNAAQLAGTNIAGFGVIGAMMR